MIVSGYFIRFILFSFFGWIYECIFCIIKTGKWENRGFLFGPICPIYGVGAITAMIVFYEFPCFSGKDTAWWEILLVCLIGSAVLEYSVSVVLERIFQARWWDYSDFPLNINGRTSIPSILGFGIVGLFLVKAFFPWIDSYFVLVEAHPLILEIVSLTLMFIFAMDIALTVASLTSLIAILDELWSRFDEKMETSVEIVTSVPRVLKTKGGEVTTSLKNKVSTAPAFLKEKVAYGVKLTDRIKIKERIRLTEQQRKHLRSIITFKNVNYARLVELLKKEEEDES